MAHESYITLKSILNRPKDFFALIVVLLAINQMQKIKVTKTLFTWSGGTRSSGVDFFCFVCFVSLVKQQLFPRGPVMK